MRKSARICKTTRFVWGSPTFFFFFFLLFLFSFNLSLCFLSFVWRRERRVLSCFTHILELYRGQRTLLSRRALWTKRRESPFPLKQLTMRVLSRCWLFSCRDDVLFIATYTTTSLCVVVELWCEGSGACGTSSFLSCPSFCRLTLSLSLFTSRNSNSNTRSSFFRDGENSVKGISKDLVDRFFFLEINLGREDEDLAYNFL